jgi:hypothetical protein
MSRTFFRWPIAKRSPMGSTISFTIMGSSMWELIMIPLSLRWKHSTVVATAGQSTLSREEGAVNYGGWGRFQRGQKSPVEEEAPRTR